MLKSILRFAAVLFVLSLLHVELILAIGISFFIICLTDILIYQQRRIKIYQQMLADLYDDLDIGLDDELESENSGMEDAWMPTPAPHVISETSASLFCNYGGKSWPDWIEVDGKDRFFYNGIFEHCTGSSMYFHDEETIIVPPGVSYTKKSDLIKNDIIEDN